MIKVHLLCTIMIFIGSTCRFLLNYLPTLTHFCFKWDWSLILKSIRNFISYITVFFHFSQSWKFTFGLLILTTSEWWTFYLGLDVVLSFQELLKDCHCIFINGRSFIFVSNLLCFPFRLCSFMCIILSYFSY